MSRELRSWIWVFCAVWTVLLAALYAANAQEKPKDVTHVVIALTDGERSEIISSFDAYQLAMAKYIAAMDKAAKAHKLPSVKEGMRFDIGAGPCNPQTNGKLVCERTVTPVMPEVKSNVPPPSAPVPTDKK